MTLAQHYLLFSHSETSALSAPLCSVEPERHRIVNGTFIQVSLPGSSECAVLGDLWVPHSAGGVHDCTMMLGVEAAWEVMLGLLLVWGFLKTCFLIPVLPPTPPGSLFLCLPLHPQLERFSFIEFPSQILC